MNWRAHIIRMPFDNVINKVLQFKVTGIQKSGRPKLRWADSVESEFGIINEKTLVWSTKVNKKSLWMNLQKKALAHKDTRYDDEEELIYFCPI
ncbi:hypothetical protein TNCV_3350711 [Trichonephila clavipes]|nr:hypothetical protein TNCV_3350711 [Trichonephila clavipes]